MVLIELIFEFIGEYLKFNQIKLKHRVLVGLIGFFVIAFMYCWWVGI